MLMMHRFSLPTEAEMENLITQVYEGMFNPDQSRLSLIESKLLRESKKDKSQNNLNKIPWWIVLVLAGGFAAAAWWAGEMFIDTQNMEIKEKQIISSDKIIEQQPAMNYVEPDAKNKKYNNETLEDRDSPVIYQRETF
jgi:hypothetical protein